jgi:hypothetical protein
MHVSCCRAIITINGNLQPTRCWLLGKCSAWLVLEYITNPSYSTSLWFCPIWNWKTPAFYAELAKRVATSQMQSTKNIQYKLKFYILYWLFVSNPSHPLILEHKLLLLKPSFVGNASPFFQIFLEKFTFYIDKFYPFNFLSPFHFSF